MALQINRKLLNSSLVIPEAYIHIDRVELINKTACNILVCVYATKEDKDSGLPGIESVLVNVLAKRYNEEGELIDNSDFSNHFSSDALDREGSNLIKAAYLYLLSQEEFANAKSN